MQYFLYICSEDRQEQLPADKGEISTPFLFCIFRD
nr:MAG TPA: hypothetical protein [Caudoviricetes sp.]